MVTTDAWPCTILHIFQHHDIIEVHYCVVTMKGKLVSIEHSINFTRVQDVSIRRSSSVIIQNFVIYHFN